MTTPTTDPRPFDPAAPLPPMRSHGSNPRDSWEPAARHYRDLTEEEKASNE